jgi:hypothetical protein
MNFPNENMESLGLWKIPLEKININEFVNIKNLYLNDIEPYNENKLCLKKLESLYEFSCSISISDINNKCGRLKKLALHGIKKSNIKVSKQ